MRVLGSLVLLVAVIVFGLAGLVLGAVGATVPGCAASQHVVEAEAVSDAHKSCTALLVAQAELSASLKESCDARAERLNAVAHQESDCLVYMGWADLTAKDVCK